MALKLGYKLTDVGVIPEDWDAKEIGDDIDLLAGYPFSSARYTNSGIRLLRGSNVKRGKIDWSEDISEYWPKITADVSRYQLMIGDLVIAMDGSLVGRSFAQLSSFDVPALLLQRVARIRSKKIDAGYLSALFGSEKFITYMDSVKTVTAIPHISPSDIRKFRAAIPKTVNEQRAIAGVLSDVDALLDALDRLIAKKRDLKQAAMQQLLTGQKRLPGFNEKWILKRLGCMAKIQRGASPRPIENPIWFDEQSSVGWVRISDVTKSGMYLRETTQHLSLQGSLNSRRVKSDSLIMSICATVGRPVITALDACIHDGFVVFDDLKVEKLFLYYFLQSIESNWSKQGQTGSQMNLNTELINRTKITMPPSSGEQTEIAEVLFEIDAELAALEQRRDKTRALKQGMLQELLTGKTRLVA